MPRFFIHFCFLTFLCGLPRHAQASQWQTLNGTARYKVDYDEQSIHHNPLGQLEIWIRFIPRGEAERKSAAVEYKEKRYHSHLEYYEIDCSEQTARLGMIDILDKSRVRLKRLQGSSKPAPILPGSVLENVAEHFCPVIVEEIEEENKNEESAQGEQSENTDDLALSSDKRQMIEKLQKIAMSKEATFETWKELGNIYFDTNQPEQAIKAYARALSFRPDDTDILNDQGAMYRQSGDYQRAVANFEKAFSLDPHNLESLYNCGYVYAFDLGNTQKALVMWRQYITLESKSETARQVQSFIDQYGKPVH